MSIIASNFKTNHTRKSTALFINEVNEYLKKENILSEVYVFPTATSLDFFETEANFIVGTQNAYATASGSFTGEIGTVQLDEFEIKTILIGHSERRHILGETQDLIAQKYEFYKNLGYKIIYCIGEPLEVKNQGIEKTLEYIYEQFIDIDTNYSNLILAYEPVWAIGTGVTATNDDIGSVHKAIKEKINKPLLYGGSVKPENAKELFNMPDIDGGLVGGASLKADVFSKIVNFDKE